MKMEKTVAAIMVLAFAAVSGCVCGSGDGCRGEDPVIGNWSGSLPVDRMPAVSFIFTRDGNGEAKAFVLYRWGSPMLCSEVEIKGGAFSLRHPYGQAFEGEVLGDRMFARIAPWDSKTGRLKGTWQPFECYRNPPPAPGVSTDEATFGEPIDLLGEGLGGFTGMDGSEMEKTWSFSGGVLSNRVTGPDGRKIHGANIVTKRADFFDFKLDYDVRVPKGANSGVYLRGRFEIQTLDSFGKPLDEHNMAAYYGRVKPLVAAEKPAGEWQHVSVVVYRRRLTVTLNGKRIIDNAVLEGVTGGAIDADLFKAGPVYIQGDHSDADYRNMILRPAL